jgi:hypothetical protein
MLRDLGECKTKHRRFDVIGVVGHSNMSGIAVTGSSRSDFMPWDMFATFLEPFQPKRIALIACQAGAWLPATALFGGVPTLRELFGSPVLTREDEMAILHILVPLLLARVRIEPEVFRVAQAANFALTRGVLFRQTRAEFQRADAVEDLARVSLDVFLNAIVHGCAP